MFNITLKSGFILTINEGNYKGDLSVAQAVINKAMQNQGATFEYYWNTHEGVRDNLGEIKFPKRFSSKFSDTMNTIPDIDPCNIEFDLICDFCFRDTDPDSIDNAVVLKSGVILTFCRGDYEGDLTDAMKAIRAFVRDNMVFVDMEFVERNKNSRNTAGWVHVKGKKWFHDVDNIPVDNMLRYCELTQKVKTIDIQLKSGEVLKVNTSLFAGNIDNAKSVIQSYIAANDLTPLQPIKLAWYEKDTVNKKITTKMVEAFSNLYQYLAYQTPVREETLPTFSDVSKEELSVDMDYLLKCCGVEPSKVDAIAENLKAEAAAKLATEQEAAQRQAEAKEALEKNRLKEIEERARAKLITNCQTISKLLDGFNSKIAQSELTGEYQHPEILPEIKALEAKLKAKFGQLNPEECSKMDVADFIDFTKNEIQNSLPTLKKDLVWYDYLLNFLKKIQDVLTGGRYHEYFKPKVAMGVSQVEELEQGLGVVNP